MKERLLDLEDDREARHVVLGGELSEELWVSRDPGGPIHPRSVLVPGDQDDQFDVRVLDDIAQGIRHPVAWPVRQDERPVVKEPDGSNGVTS